ncbi:MAG TPA: BTAD domain-containing putative transcriptional regulator, partial [Candidatus Acidoferrum sp.]|nr:BTAD domain-containing putative transcriptional regulator [Candidatus Acidoferrum sp.]
MAQVRLSLLGGVQIQVPSGQTVTLPARKAQALLAYLALHPGQAHPRDKLAALLWGNVPAERARHSLRQVLVGLRQALPRSGPAILLEEADAVAISSGAIDVDVASFERLAADFTADGLTRAIALYRGDLLEGLAVQEPPFEEWLLTERERLRELAVEALAKLLAHHLKAGSRDEAIQTGVRLLGLDPAHEAVHRTLMRLYARQGRRGAALAQYQACVSVLERELGIEPEAETKRLYHEVLQSRAAHVPARGEGDPPPEALMPAMPEAASGPPLVGRDTFLDQLRETWDSACLGRGRICVVLGEAGIGKSRLIAGLTGEAVSRGGRLLIGAAHETGQILPFGPWVDAFRRGGVITELEGQATPVTSWIGELARVFPEIGGPEPPPRLGATDYLRVFEAVTKLVVHLAAERPLLLVLEDLHWGDDMSLRLLAYLGRRVAACPVFLLATAREEELVGAPRLRGALEELGRETHFARITLPPLSQPDTVALVQALVRTGIGASALTRLGDQVWAASGGNPFIAVEMIRAVHEGRTDPLPQPVRDTIAGRLERLPNRARHVAAVASVIGRDFDFALLLRAAGLTPDDAAEGVEELVGRRILHVVGERLDFTHDRISEVTYDSLLPPRRQVLHGAVGRALEGLYAERLAEVFDRLAFHYSQARDAGKAVDYLVRSADQAVRASAHEQAVKALEDALGHAPGLPEQGRDRVVLDLMLRQAFSLSNLGRFREILDLLVAHRARIVRTGDPKIAGPYFFRLGLTYSYLGEQEEAGRTAEQALAAAEQCGDGATAGKTCYVLSLQRHYTGRPREGITFGERAVALLERTGETNWLGLVHWVLGLNHHALGEFDEALAAILETERRAIRVRVAGEERLIAAEDAGRYRDALGAMPPGGLPEVFLEGGPDSLRELVLRFARGRGPFTTADANERFGRDVEPLLRDLEREELLVRGELRPGGSEREWCDPDVLRRLRRASLAALRREVEPAERAAFGRFLPHWQGVDRRST